jgi:hypothetical protein
MRPATLFLDWLSKDSSFWRALPLGDLADRALDRRDSEDSESAWLREEAAVKATSTPLATSRDLIEKIAEIAFRKAYEASEHHDLAAQVSDDLRLLAEAAEVGYASPTLTVLWAAYQNGEFPEVVA